jgi:hypothetical protein
VLQLQLYLRAGCPIYYAVPEGIPKADMPRSCAAGKSTGDFWSEISTFLREKIFSGKLSEAADPQKLCVHVIERIGVSLRPSITLRAS